MWLDRLPCRDSVATAARLLSAQVDGVQGLVVDAAGNIFLSDYNNHRVRRVDRATGIITTVAGDGTPGFFGEGIPAAIAWLWHPTALAFDAGGNLLITDTYNQRIRRVDALTGLITTVAGNGLVGLLGRRRASDLGELQLPLWHTRRARWRPPDRRSVQRPDPAGRCGDRSDHDDRRKRHVRLRR